MDNYKWRASLIAQLIKNQPVMYKGGDRVPRASNRNQRCPYHQGFPGGSDGKASACNSGDPGSIPELGRSPGEGNGNPLQYSCLEKSMDRGALQATVHWVAKSQTRLSDFTSLSLAWALLPEKRRSDHPDPAGPSLLPSPSSQFLFTILSSCE